MSNSTKDNLLNAALDIFAKSGFKSATVQEIATRAGANISAINYHFGNKANFYAEAVVYHIKREVLCKSDHNGKSSTPEAELRDFIEHRLTAIAKDKNPGFIEKILMQEMANPGPVLDKMVEQVIRPEIKKLSGIMATLLPDDCSESEVRRHALSVVAQCNFYLHAQPVLSSLYPDLELDREETRRLVDHISSTCLAAVRAEYDKRQQL